MAMSVGDSRLIISPSQAATAQAPTRVFRVSQVRRLRKCQQVAAVCYRIRGSGIEFLLVQTRGGRWTFPKGGVEPGLTHAQAAALEAYEEAGAHGRMEEVSFTRYVRRKGSGSSSAIEVGVSAHLCEVLRLGPLHQFFEDFAPVLVISKLVEAGAGGSQQHDISRLGTCACPLNGTVQRFRMNNLGRFPDPRFNLVCCCADGIDALYSLAQKIVEDGVVAAFVFSSQNKMDVRGK